MTVESFGLTDLPDTFDPYNPHESKNELDKAYAHFANMLNYVCIRHPEMLPPGFPDEVEKMLAETWDYFDVRQLRSGCGQGPR